MISFSRLPKRYVFAVMGFLATLIGHMIRISLDLTIARMVNETDTEEALYDPYSCPEFGILVSNQSGIDPMKDFEPGPYDWEKSAQSSLYTVFSRGYVITQFIGGMIAEQQGGKNVLGISFLTLSICTFISPLATKFLGSKALYVLRFISGMASGPIIPVLLSMMSKWIPNDERAFIASIIFPGALLGHVAGSYLGDVIILFIGWETVYYTFAVLGLTWCCLWKYFIFSDPNAHPTVSESEKRFLNDTVTSFNRSTKYDLDPLPWKAYLRCGALWGTAGVYIGREWAFAIFTKQVPQYIRDVLRLDISYCKYLSQMPYVSMWLASLLFGFSCDILIKRGYCSVKNARKIFTFIAATGASLSMIIIMYSGCSHTLAVFFMFTGMILLGSYYSGCMIGALDFAPNYAGTMVGIIDNIAINSVLLMPRINAFILTDAIQSQWRISFWVVIIILVTTIPVYFYYVQADQVWWDDVRKNGYPENWKYGLFECMGVIDENGESVYTAKKNYKQDVTKTSERNML